MTSQLSTSPGSATTEVADFGTRFSAFMADAAIVFAVQWVIVIALARQLQAAGWTSVRECAPGSVQFCEGPSTLLWALVLLVLLASTVGYHALFEGLLGTTPGKRLVGLRVVNNDGRSPIGLVAGALRAVIRQGFWLVLFFVFEVSPLSLGLPAALNGLLLVLGLVTFAVGAFSADGLALHDRVAQTRVVRGVGAARQDSSDNSEPLDPEEPNDH